uniref:Coiled-coil domain containing 154 n=1 Tax=Microcebus murinus TaxID=30608 RepID=A0A8C5V0M3_MICMU
LAEPVNSSPSLGTSAPSRLSTIVSEDLGLLMGSLASPEALSLELSDRDSSSHLASSPSDPELDTAKHWTQLEQWVSSLQAEVACLRGQEERRERATRSLLRELLRVRALVQVQDSELQRLQQEAAPAAPTPEKLSSSPHFLGLWACRMWPLCARLVEVREALAQIRRRQTLQDSERKATEQEVALRLAKLTDSLRQEEQGREAACSALRTSQEDAGQWVGHEVARMQAQVTTLGEEMSLRFLKREAKLCSFLQKSFLALEKRMKAAESSRLRLEGRLREELERRWELLRELMEERLRTLCGQRQVRPAGGRQEEGHLLEQCRGLDAAVVQLTKFVRQNQASLSRVLLAEQKALDAKGRLEDGQAGALASQVQESLEVARRARELALQETHSQLSALREKSQALEASVAQLAGQLKDLSDQFLALSCRLDLQGQMLGLRLCEAKTEWEGVEKKSLEDLARWQKEVAVHLQDMWEKVDSLPRQIEGVSDKCTLHKSDSDVRISAEGKARESEVGALRRELAALLSSVQLLKEDNHGRKIAEMQGRMATNQIMKLENSIQANKTIQNLQFNTESKLRSQDAAARRESAGRLRGEEGPRAPALGSCKTHTSQPRQRLFVKDLARGKAVPVNCWGLYQAVRWLRWKVTLLKLAARRRPGAVQGLPHSRACAAQLI